MRPGSATRADVTFRSALPGQLAVFLLRGSDLAMARIGPRRHPESCSGLTSRADPLRKPDRCGVSTGHVRAAGTRIRCERRPASVRVTPAGSLALARAVLCSHPVTEYVGSLVRP